MNKNEILNPNWLFSGITFVMLLLTLAFWFNGHTQVAASVQDEPRDQPLQQVLPTMTANGDMGSSKRLAVQAAQQADAQAAFDLSFMADVTCENGMASQYPCLKVDLMSVLPLDSIGGGEGADLWGWTDSQTGKEYALMTRTNGTAFVDISDAKNPVYLGNLPSHTGNSLWRDVKVYQNHAFIVSDNNGNHGVQIFDLTQLRTVTQATTFSETAHYGNIGSAHNIAINENTGYAYVVGGVSGTNTCGSGLHMINIQNPTQPTFAGCFSADGYTHDAQCVVYNGPDSEYQGQEICFNANEDTLTIVNVQDKSNPAMLAREGYSGSSYTHQNWLTEDQRYLLINDELDEQNNGHNTRTYIWDVSDLDNPTLSGQYTSDVASIDHNLYIHNGYVYQANYRSGLRILSTTDIANGNLSEVGYFDIYPLSDSASYNGAWSVYPFFESGNVIVSGIEQGLFVLRAQLEPDVATPTPSATSTASPTAMTTVTAIGSPTTTASSTPTATAIPTATGSPGATSTPTTATPVPSGAILRTHDYTVAPGNSFTMKVEAANVAAPGLSAANVTLFYDHNVIQPTTCTVDSALIGTCNSNVNGQIQFNLLSTSGLQGEFDIIEVLFQAVGQENESSALDLSTTVFADSDGHAISLTVQDGSATIGKSVGDVSCDNLVNVVDALYILQYDVGSRSAANSCPLASGTLLLDHCDVSKDNSCNSVDALFVLQCDVGISNTFCPARFPVPPSANNQPTDTAGGATVEVGSHTVSPSSTVNVPVRANLGNTQLGAATIQVRFDPDIVQVTACQVANSLVGQCNADNAKGLISFNALSTSGVTGNITLADITLQATSEGTSSLDVSMPTFADSTGQTIAASDVDGQINVTSSNTLFLPAVRK